MKFYEYFYILINVRLILPSAYTNLDYWYWILFCFVTQAHKQKNKQKTYTNNSAPTLIMSIYQKHIMSPLSSLWQKVALLLLDKALQLLTYTSATSYILQWALINFLLYVGHCDVSWGIKVNNNSGYKASFKTVTIY